MHPAPSIILFSTLSGAGFGLLALYCLGIGPIENSLFNWISLFIGYFLATAGLIASTFHLKHPERAIRAFTQWRSSWLSIEGVLAICTLGVIAIYSFCLLILNEKIIWLGLSGSALAISTVFSTSMIYAQLPTVPRWHTPLTPIVFLICATSSGILVFSSIIEILTSEHFNYSYISITIICITWLIIQLNWNYFRKTTLEEVGSSPESATGLADWGKVRLLESPHTNPNYLMKEMVYIVGRKHANRLRQISAFIGAIIPIILLIFGLVIGFQILLFPVAAFFHLIGIFISRWLFFAEAQHSVSLYYGNR